ncbi:hypothetical protein B1218_36125, partial [Pseudomonas ogarae]
GGRSRCERGHGAGEEGVGWEAVGWGGGEAEHAGYAAGRVEGAAGGIRVGRAIPGGRGLVLWQVQATVQGAVRQRDGAQGQVTASGGQAGGLQVGRSRDLGE